MDMDIEDIINFDSFKESTIIAGQRGLKNKVSNVTFIDAPDGHNWCREGDFIVTTGYPFVTDDGEEGFLKLLRILVNKKCSGVGVKFGRYISDVSKKAKKFVDQTEFPIVSLSNKLSWSDILYPIMFEINKKQKEELLLIHQIYERFQRFLKEQGDLKDLTQLLHEYLNTSIIIYIQNYKKIIKSDNSFLSMDDIEEITVTFFSNREQKIQNIRWANKDVSIKWIFSDNELEGAIFLQGIKYNFKTWETAVVEQAIAIILFKIERLKAISTTVQRFQNNFIHNLLENENLTKEALSNHANDIGWDLKNNYKVLLLNAYFEEQKHSTEVSKWEQQTDLLETMRNHLTYMFPEILSGFDRNNHIVILITESTSLDSLLTELRKLINKLRIVRFLVGVGRLKPTNALKRSHTEADIALRASSKFFFDADKNSKKIFVTKFSSLSIERIVFSENPKKEINALTEEYLAEVIAYDAHKNSSLMYTLKMYLKFNANLRKTAEKLIVHKNTVRYRLSVIESLTSLNLKKPTDYLLLQMIVVSNDIIR